MYIRQYELRIGQNLSAAYTSNIRESYDPSANFEQNRVISDEVVRESVNIPGPEDYDITTNQDQVIEVNPDQQALNRYYLAGEVWNNAIQSFNYDIDDLLASEDSRIFISENQIKFEIEKTGKEASEGNVGEITLYNLSDDSAYLIENLSGVENFIELKAGYQDEELKTIFRGNVQDVEDKFDGKERRTKISLTDGGAFIQSQMTSRKYPAGTRYDKIIDDLLNDLALDRGYIARLGDDVVTRKPLVVHGKAAGELARILDNFGFNFNIQDMFTYVLNSRVDVAVGASQGRTSFIGGESQVIQEIPLIPLVSPETGLIETPSFKSESSDLSSAEKDEQATTGVEFKSLLNGEFNPNSLVKLDSVKATGVYRIIKVTHRGNYRGDEWYSEVEAELAPVQFGSDTNDSDEPLYTPPYRPSGTFETDPTQEERYGPGAPQIN